MTHAEVVAAAARWLWTARGCVVVISELSTSCMETPDVIGWTHRGGSILVEAKISRADFRRDRQKVSRRLPDWQLGSRRYYAAPIGLLAPADVVESGWGLIEVNGQKAREVVAGVESESEQRAEILFLLSAVRRMPSGRGARVKVYTFDNLEREPRAEIGVLPDDCEALEPGS